MGGLPKEAAGKAPATEGDINAHLMARVDNDFDALRQEYEQIPETQGGSLLDTDLARELSPEYRADRTRASEVQKSASEFVYRMYVEALKRLTPPGKVPLVVFTAGGSGAGKSSSRALLGELHRKAEIIYDTTLSSFKSANKNIRQALDAGRDVEIVYTYRDPAEAYVNGVLSRAAREGRTVPIDAHIRMHEGALKTIRKLQEKYADDDRVNILVVDNTHGEGQSVLTTLDELPTPNFAGLKEKLHEALRQEHAAGRIDDAAFTASEGGTAEEHGAPRTEDDPGGKKRFPQGIGQARSRGPEPQRAQGARQEVGAAGESSHIGEQTGQAKDPQEADRIGELTDAAAGAINLMKDNDPFFINASKRADVDPDGFLDVIAHGNKTRISVQTSSGPVLMDAQQTAQHISRLGGWSGQNIRLLSCSTGASLDGFAAKLRSELGVSVVRAPSDILWADASGRLFVSAGKNLVDPVTGATQLVPTWPPTGKFVDFVSGGSK